MFSTMAVAAIFLGLLFLSAVTWAVFLWLGLWLARVPDVTTRRVIVATVIAAVLDFVIEVAFLIVTPLLGAKAILFGVAAVAAKVFGPCVVISMVFRTRLPRALLAWLPTLLAWLVGVPLFFLVVRPFVLETFVVPTNAMAPALLGRHWQGVCPECGSPNYCSPVDTRYSWPGRPWMICDKYHVTRATDVDEQIHSGDRFVVAKFITPQRWDILVFRHPAFPEQRHVMRVVGLPGETIHIADGALWVDGKRQTPPDSLYGIEYVTEFPGRPPMKCWATEDEPAQLGEDEYFVLGDFSEQAMDSRLWEAGDPEHHPYAVPKSHVVGVVTHTYWPPHRWRIHR